MPLDRPGEVGHFFRVIGEWIISGSVLEQEFRLVERDVLERNGVLDLEAPGFSDKVRNRNAIVEDVVDPTKPVRTRLNLEGRLEKPLIIAVARAEHDPMLTQAHGRSIGVGREMFHSQNRHVFAIEFLSRAPAARTLAERGIVGIMRLCSLSPERGSANKRIHGVHPNPRPSAENRLANNSVRSASADRLFDSNRFSVA